MISSAIGTRMTVPNGACPLRCSAMAVSSAAGPFSRERTCMGVTCKPWGEDTFDDVVLYGPSPVTTTTTTLPQLQRNLQSLAQEFFIGSPANTGSTRGIETKYIFWFWFCFFLSFLMLLSPRQFFKQE